MPEQKKQSCFVCGYRTLENRCDWDICPVCFWEDDVLVETQDECSPANRGMMVSTAQANFIRFGAVSPEFIDHVREPGPDEEKDPDWAPLSKTLEILGKIA
jgi:hypothetical protein